MAFVGANVCPGGWVAVRIDDNLARPASAEVFPDVTSLMGAWGDASSILVGIPIGLQDAGHPRRAAFQLARDLLKPQRHHSVSPVPSRAAVEAFRSGEARSYEALSERNHRALGKKLSKQSAAMVAKIAELDALMLTDADARGKLREAHRELCFWGLNGGRPMSCSKAQPEGIAERLGVLVEYLPWAHEFFDDVWRGSRPKVPLAVVVDALATALTAVGTHPFLGDLQSIPPEPQRDARGLPMEVVYRLPRELADADGV
ncbi:MAG: DUF429 domain-containing protein [Chloroflexi bacterium]|nr:DUF429 domain-containing protein [Chloroflexota bacterium]